MSDSFLLFLLYLQVISAILSRSVSQSLISVCLSSLVVPVSIFLSPFGSLSCFGFYIYSFILLNSDFLMFAFLIYMTLKHMSHTLGLKSYWFSFSQQLSHSMWSSLIHFYTERKKSSCCVPYAFVLYYYFSLSVLCVFGCSYPYKIMMWFKVGCFCLRLLCSQ